MFIDYFFSFPGLGTSTSKEAKEYFSDMVRHRIRFRYGGREDDESLDMAFSKKKIEDRKAWLTNWMAVQFHLYYLYFFKIEFCYVLI